MLKFDLFSQMFVESGAGHWFPLLSLLAESGERCITKCSLKLRWAVNRWYIVCQAISDHGNHLSRFRLLLLAVCLLVMRKRRGYLKLR